MTVGFGTTADGTAYPSALHFTKLGFDLFALFGTAGKTAKPLVGGFVPSRADTLGLKLLACNRDPIR